MTKEKNIENLLVDLQKLLKEYNATIEGFSNNIGIRILNKDGLSIQSFATHKVTSKEVIKFLD